ncbi:MAG: ATP-binding cassette domain-containing protein [Pseudomonadota bacterium]
MPEIHVENLSLHFPVFTQIETSAGDDGGRAGANVKSGGGRRRFVEALSEVSFSLKAGDRLGLVGRNGSGKSTLLRVLGGIYPPTQGIVQVEGSIAPLFNVGLGVRPESSGRRNILLRGLLRGLKRKEAEAKVDEIADFADIGPFIDLPMRTYSTGMAMRLSFAMATAFSPEVLLLDEWIGAGDQRFRKKAQDRMNSLVNDASITVIASHNRPLLSAVCSHALWLERGAMMGYGPIEEVYKKVDAYFKVGQPDVARPAPVLDTAISEAS